MYSLGSNSSTSSSTKLLWLMVKVDRVQVVIQFIGIQFAGVEVRYSIRRCRSAVLSLQLVQPFYPGRQSLEEDLKHQR